MDSQPSRRLLSRTHLSDCHPLCREPVWCGHAAQAVLSCIRACHICSALFLQVLLFISIVYPFCPSSETPSSGPPFHSQLLCLDCYKTSETPSRGHSSCFTSSNTEFFFFSPFCSLWRLKTICSERLLVLIPIKKIIQVNIKPD